MEEDSAMTLLRHGRPNSRIPSHATHILINCRHSLTSITALLFLDPIIRLVFATIMTTGTRLLWRRLGIATTTASVSAVGYATYLYQTDPGVPRMVHAYSSFIPVVLRYRWAEVQAKYFSFFSSHYSKIDWDQLDEFYAKPTVAQLGILQGMYCKYGQTAAGLTNTFGEAWIREFRTLENEVPPRPLEVVLETIEQETAKPWQETFSYIDERPLGSASIGQVHRAILKKTGQEVAIKVQYPEAQRLFHEDIASIRRFCQALAPEHVVALDALEKSNIEELDYRNEAANLLEIQSYMRDKHALHPHQVVVPSPLLQYTTDRLLVMELVPGVKLMEGIRTYYEKWARQQGTTLHHLEVEARARIEREGIPAKYSGPPAWQMTIYRRSLQVQDALWNASAATYRGTLGWIPGIPLPSYRTSQLPPNIPRIVDTLMRVHGKQLLEDGVFQSDPHGGNFLLMPDGRIGLIDYGATKRLTKEERLSTCLLYAALYRKDEDRLATMCKIGGYKSKYGRTDVLLKLLQFGYDSYGKDVTGGKNVQQFLDELKATDPWEEVPDNFVMAQFMSIRLRSLFLGMNHPVKCSDWWGPMAEQVLKDEGLPYETWDMEQMEKYKPELNMQKYKFA